MEYVFGWWRKPPSIEKGNECEIFQFLKFIIFY